MNFMRFVGWYMFCFRVGDERISKSKRNQNKRKRNRSINSDTTETKKVDIEEGNDND